MKNIEKIIIKIGVCILLVLYLIRFALGVTGIPGPYLGTSVRQVDVSKENQSFNMFGYFNKLFNREKYEYLVPDFSKMGFSTDGRLPKSDISKTKYTDPIKYQEK